MHVVNEKKYHLTISPNTIDKLGVKLYDKASDVVSELVANSYDADAENVKVTIPLGEFLATKSGTEVKSKDLKIVVEDDGHGFSESEANDFYLKIGADRRKDPVRQGRGARSPEHDRPVMGRKGIGKLAAFGICRRIEVWSASGGKQHGPYRVSHFVLDYDDIIDDTGEEYNPPPGDCDGDTSTVRGTRITLSNFLYKKIPDGETFMRQVARKFGIGSVDFTVLVTNSTTGETRQVSDLDIELLQGTQISLDERPVPLGTRLLPVRGWIAYAKHSYRNEEMAGVRIYANGKLATTTRDFGRKSGFTGEFTIRTYMVGAIHADWLDEDEDLIASDRQDILWSSEEGDALQKWGQLLLVELGRTSWGPLRKKSFEEFKEKSKLEYHAKARFGNTQVYDAALEIGKKLASGSSAQSLQNEDYVKGLLELILSIAPHKTIVDKLKQIADDGNSNAMSVISTLFSDAKIAETASMGQVVEERIRVIETLEIKVRERPPVDELDLQRVLESAPWLIEPQWTVLQANRMLSTFRSSFEKFYENETGNAVRTSTTESDSSRPDFLMLSVKKRIEIVEIKRADHVLNAEDYKRLYGYIEWVKKFLDDNTSYAEWFSSAHATLVVDGVNLKGIDKSSYDSLVEKNILQHKTWEDLLLETRHVHEDFIRARDGILNG